ncbi:MAG: hypothetical protein ACLQUW_08295 [Desulfobaccales bacterium]
MIEWIINNKEWVFSGFGVLLIIGISKIIYWFWKGRNSKKILDNKIPLSNIINFTTISVSIRKYLTDNNIIYNTDVYRINFDDMLRRQNIGKIGVSKFIMELIKANLLQMNDYIKKYL